MARQLTVGVGPVTADLVLDLGPHHPSAHGGLQVALVLDGDGPDARVVSADPVVGFMHRGAEKLFEVRDYRQLLVLANRHDWLAAFSNELGIVLAVERLMGLEPPPRAVWLRTLLGEVNRVLSHLAFLGAHDLRALQARAPLQRLLEEASGGRVHYMLNRVGGLLHDVPSGWDQRLRAACSSLLDLSFDLPTSLRGIGVLRTDDALAHGVSGPVARASGMPLDVRRDDPYLAYGSLDVPLVVRSGGDAFDRYDVLREQVVVSLGLVLQCLDALPGGEVGVKLPKTVRAPEGATWVWTENPTGVMGYYLVSKGRPTPWRLAMRTPSFSTASVLPALLPGVRLADVGAVLGSLFLVAGDLDK